MTDETFYVAHCPLSDVCHWTSGPEPTSARATEALRAHVNDHRHAELVTFVAEHHTVTVSKYWRQE